MAWLPGTSLVFHGLTFSCTGDLAVRVENAVARREEREGGEASRAGGKGFALPGFGALLPARAESMLCWTAVGGHGHGLHQTPMALRSVPPQGGWGTGVWWLPWDGLAAPWGSHGLGVPGGCWVPHGARECRAGLRFVAVLQLPATHQGKQGSGPSAT